MIPLKSGDQITVRALGKTLRGTVVLASENRQSLFVTFDGGIGGHMGCAPLLFEDGRYVSVIDGTEMEILPARADDC